MAAGVMRGVAMLLLASTALGAQASGTIAVGRLVNVADTLVVSALPTAVEVVLHTRRGSTVCRGSAAAARTWSARLIEYLMPVGPRVAPEVSGSDGRTWASSCSLRLESLVRHNVSELNLVYLRDGRSLIAGLSREQYRELARLMLVAARLAESDASEWTLPVRPGSGPHLTSTGYAALGVSWTSVEADRYIIAEFGGANGQSEIWTAPSGVVGVGLRARGDSVHCAQGGAAMGAWADSIEAMLALATDAGTAETRIAASGCGLRLEIARARGARRYALVGGRRGTSRVRVPLTRAAVTQFAARLRDAATSPVLTAAQVDQPAVLLSDGPGPGLHLYRRASPPKGEALIQFVVDTDGRVGEPVRVLRSSGPEFDAAVMMALENSFFAAAFKDGRRVRQVVNRLYRFDASAAR